VLSSLFFSQDFELWKLMITHIPLPEEIYFNFDQQIISKFRTSRPFILELQKTFNWPLLEILIETQGITILTDYVLKAPGGEYYLNIVGLISRETYNQMLTDSKIYMNEIKYNECNREQLESYDLNLLIEINSIINRIKILY
jgi:hypothetical protein